jgi:hypothetical protein
MLICACFYGFMTVSVGPKDGTAGMEEAGMMVCVMIQHYSVEGAYSRDGYLRQKAPASENQPLYESTELADWYEAPLDS